MKALSCRRLPRSFRSSQHQGPRLGLFQQQQRTLATQRPPADQEFLHAISVGDDDAKFLQQTIIQRVRANRPRKGDRVSLWDYLKTYKTSYDEKVVLVDKNVASEVAGAISRHSERGKDTVFIDADAGFCRVTEHVQRLNLFADYKVFQKDINLKELSDRAAKEYLPRKCEHRLVNVAQFPSNFIGNLGEFVSPLYSEGLTTSCRDGSSSSWTVPEPNYTLFATASHSLIKYFIQRYLHRLEDPFGEFYHGRPEFFFIVTFRTWMHLSACDLLSSQVLRLPNDILFRLLFDYELVTTFPRSSFFPWKNPRFSPGSLNKVTREYAKREDCLFLVKVRPKVDAGIRNPCRLPFLQYFVHGLFRRKVMRLIPILHQWHPEVALEVVRKGYSAHMLTGEVDAPDVLEIFNILASSDCFSSSSFAVMAEEYSRGRFSDIAINNRDIKSNYLSLKRKAKRP